MFYHLITYELFFFVGFELSFVCVSVNVYRI